MALSRGMMLGLAGGLAPSDPFRFSRVGEAWTVILCSKPAKQRDSLQQVVAWATGTAPCAEGPRPRKDRQAAGLCPRRSVLRAWFRTGSTDTKWERPGNASSWHLTPPPLPMSGLEVRCGNLTVVEQALQVPLIHARVRELLPLLTKDLGPECPLSWPLATCGN